MKALYLLILILFLNLSSYGQFPLEHTYDSCSTIQNSGRLMMVNLENSGYKYIKYNRVQNKIIVYSLTHVIEKEVSLPIAPNNTNHEVFTVFYFSENLFNTDNLMEFMLVRQGHSNSAYYCSTHIVNENGIVLFYRANEGPFIEVNDHQQQFPIYNTSAGTKLLLSTMTGQVKVYGLLGTLSTSITPNPMNENMTSNLFPSPAFNDITIEFELPSGVSSGKIRIYKVTGQLVKEYSINSDMNHMRISNDEFVAGNYFYEIIAEDKSYKGKQFMIMK